MKNKFLSYAIFSLLVTTLISCKKDPDGDDPAGSAHLNIFLTDAPAEYDAVYIDVQSVEIHSDEDGWKTLNVINPGIYDLLQFNSGVDTLLVSEDIEARTISQIRMILGDNNSVVVDGVVHDLATPSAETSGLKLNVHYTFEPGIIYNLWLDFDAEQSIVEKGNGDYSLKPVIHVFTQEESGAIAGSISPIDGAYYVKAIALGDTIGTYITEDGTFLISGVPSGSWDVTFLGEGGYADVIVPGVGVSIGSVTEMAPL